MAQDTVCDTFRGAGDNEARTGITVQDYL